MVAQNHTLRQAEVERLHPYQPGHVGLGVRQQHIKQVRELLLGFIWRKNGQGSCYLSQVSSLPEEPQKAERSPYYFGFESSL